MQSIVELLVRTADLAEAEGRMLRAMAIRVSFAITFILVAAGAIATGFALLLTAVYLTVQSHAGSAIAAVATGVLALAIGALFGWIGRKIGT